MNKKFLIVQQTNFGDCLYATTLAKQIKTDDPGCHITWAIAPKCKSLLTLNPFVDRVWEIPVQPDLEKFEMQIAQWKADHEFDEIIIPQLPYNWTNFDGTLRGATLNAGNRPITVSVDPVIRLTADEKNNVKKFAEKNKLTRFKNIILFECAPGSSQSKVNIQFAKEMAEMIAKDRKDTCFILSTPTQLDFANEQIIDASELTYRENAELTHYCTLLVGCSSGITWLATSDWAKKLPMIQLLDGKATIYVGMNYELAINGVDNSHIIEMINYDNELVAGCIDHILDKGLADARPQFNQSYNPTYPHIEYVARILFDNQKGFFEVLGIAKRYFRKNRKEGNPIPVFYPWVFCRLLVFKIRFSRNILVIETRNFFRKLITVQKKWYTGLMHAKQ